MKGVPRREEKEREGPISVLAKGGAAAGDCGRQPGVRRCERFRAEEEEEGGKKGKKQNCQVSRFGVGGDHRC